VPNETPVVGDGVLTIPAEEIEGKCMADQIDLSPTVANMLLTDTVGNIQASNRNARGVFDTVMGALAGTVQSNFAEVGVLEGRSVSGVLATPIAGPTNGKPAGT